MIISLKSLKSRVNKYGQAHFHYIGRCLSDDGLHSYGIVEDVYNQDILHIEEDDETIRSIFDYI